MVNELDDKRNEIQELVNSYSKLKFSSKVFEPGISIVPVNGKVIGPREIALMVEAALDGWLTTGRFNDEFELTMSKILGCKKCITVNSGSSANLIAFSTLTSPKLGDKAIKKGDEVITVAAGFPTTVNPIVQFGAIPVFVDVDEKTLNINTSLLEAALSPKTKAVMIAHTLGNPFQANIVKEFCDANGLWLIEDCCDALGSKLNGRAVGSFGDIATLSFYPAHHITMGEGGLVFSNNDELMAIAESFRDWGRDCYCKPGHDNTCNKRFCWQLGNLPHGYDHKFTYSHLGYNLKITDMQAACGLAQVERLEEFIEARKRNFKFLRNNLEDLSDLINICQPTVGSDPSWFGFPITLKSYDAEQRNNIIQYLNSKNIGTRLLFAGNLTRQPYFENVDYRIASSLEVTDKIMNGTFWVGVYPGLQQEHLTYIVSSLKEAFGVGF